MYRNIASRRVTSTLAIAALLAAGLAQLGHGAPLSASHSPAVHSEALTKLPIMIYKRS